MKIADGKILVVNDERVIMMKLEWMLQNVGYSQIRCIMDPREVISTVEEFDPDIILLDLHMPHLSGFDVLNHLRGFLPSDTFLPIVMVTADTKPESRMRALAGGATDFLNSPFDETEITLRIGNLIRMRQLHLQVQTQNEKLEETVARRTMDLKNALHRLEQTQQNVIQQERLHAFSAMAGGVVHDFNNVLSVILGFGELALDDCKRDSQNTPLTEHLQTIVTAALDGASMVTRLREFYRPATTDEPRSAVDLNALIEQAATITKPKWKAQALQEGNVIRIEIDLKELPFIAGNAPELREVFTNLIFNAVDAMPNGGTITMRTYSEVDDVVVEFIDTGIGMSEEVRRRCLDPFFTTKGEKGTGLGLAMVYGIVERHGGTTDIQSALGHGTKFILRLPKQIEREDLRGSALSRIERSLNILVVDDQPVLCEILTEYLRHDLHTVESARNGKEALEKFGAGTFDLVITDQAMPEMTGIQLAETIKAQSPGTSVILITGFSALSDIDKPTDIDCILGKPVSLIELREAIAEAVKHANDPS